MTFIPSELAPTFEQAGTFVVGLASPSRGSREIAAWRLRLAPGSASPDHELTREEVFVALAGEAVATLDGLRHELRAGDALVVHPGQPFRLAVEAHEPFEAVVCMPAGGKAMVDGKVFSPPWAE
jgi:quercetin dioxygenase-like cupin family protein